MTDGVTGRQTGPDSNEYGPLLTRVKLAKLLSVDPRQVDRHAKVGNIAELRPGPRARSLYLLRDVMFSLASNVG